MTKYTPLILMKMKELHKNNPDFTFGEILYSVMREPNLGIKKNFNVIELTKIKDEDYLKGTENAIKND